MKLLANLATSPPLDGICVGPASAYFFRQKKKTETNKCWGEKKTLTASLPVYRVSVCSCAALRWGQLQPCGCFQLGWTIKYGQAGLSRARSCYSVRRSDVSRGEEIGRGSARNGPQLDAIGPSRACPRRTQCNQTVPRDEPPQTSAGFNKVLNPPPRSQLIGPPRFVFTYKSSRHE